MSVELPEVMTDNEYELLWTSLRITYDNLITEDNEIEMMDTIVAMWDKMISTHLGETVKQNAGIEYWSAREHNETSSDGKSKKAIYIGDKCRKHIHIHTCVKMDHATYMKANIMKLDKNDKEIYNVTERFGVCRKLFWEAVRQAKIFPEEWNSMFNQKSIVMSTKITQDDPDIWLFYPTKEVLFHKERLWGIGRSNIIEDTARWRRGYDDRDKWTKEVKERGWRLKRDMDLSQKKKATALAKTTSSWAVQLATWVQKNCDVYTQKKVDNCILMFYEKQAKKFCLMDIVKDRNLFMLTYVEDTKGKMLEELSGMK